jgi:myo-inositol-1(or 4)-monophosphatase
LPVDPLYLATAVEAALACGRIHRQYFRQDLEIHKKGRIDLVTAADLAAEKMFRQLVAARFPEHVVLGEEEAGGQPHGGAAFHWIIDPVDGTTNFAHGLALFCVSIALLIDGELQVGVVYDPISEELFTAERGQGSRLNGRPLRVSRTTTLVDAMLCTGFPYTVREDRAKQLKPFAAFLGEAQALRRLGSAALDLAYVAAGRFDGFWEEHLHPWDLAAGALLVLEAGGTVTGVDGTPFDVFGGHLTASNGVLHPAMVDVIVAARKRDSRPPADL